MAARTSVEQLVRDGERASLRVHRQNLLQVCGLAVKAIVDRSCTDVIDDDSPELYHLCTAVEHVMLLGYKGDQGSSAVLQQISLETLGLVLEPHDFWPYITAVLGDSNAVKTVESMDNIATALGKCRAWLFINLVQKSAGQCFSRLLNNNELSRFVIRLFDLQTIQFGRNSYADYSIVRNEEGQFLSGLLEALNSVDFLLCLKDNPHLNLPYSPFIDYFHFIRPLLENGRATQLSDSRAQQRSSDASSNRSAVMEHDDTVVISLSEFSALQKRLERECQQKTYLEEVLKTRDHQIALLMHEKEAMHNKMDAVAAEAEHERKELQAIVLELHDKICQQESQLRSNEDQPSSHLDETDYGQVHDPSDVTMVVESPWPKSFFQKLFGRSKKTKPKNLPHTNHYDLCELGSELVVNGDDKVTSDPWPASDHRSLSDTETSNESRGDEATAANPHHSGMAKDGDNLQDRPQSSPSTAANTHHSDMAKDGDNLQDPPQGSPSTAANAHHSDMAKDGDNLQDPPQGSPSTVSRYEEPQISPSIVSKNEEQQSSPSVKSNGEEPHSSPSILSKPEEPQSSPSVVNKVDEPQSCPSLASEDDEQDSNNEEKD